MIKDELVELFSPTITSLGYELWGCEYLAQGKHSLLRIYIDTPVGIKVEDCESVSKHISALLDVEDPISGNYHLEVSSPGIPRPLFYTWQYERYIGQEVQVKTYKPVQGKRKFSGNIVSVTADTLVLNGDGEQLEIDFTNIVKANLTV